MPSIGLYVHIPFCLSKCAYCDFASEALGAAGGMPSVRRYLDAVAVEMDLRSASPEFQGAPVETVYVGGGTPTVAPVEWLADMVARLKLRFPFRPEAEVTVEANPGTVAEEKIAALLAAGANRLSLGVQSFSDSVLKTLGRIHTAEEAEAAMRAARAAGCSNVNVDLMYGVPNQSLEEWESTLGRTAAAEPEHIAAYGLSVEAGTPLAADIEGGRLPAPDEDVSADMYLLAADMLRDAGYRHYEISNFALPGRECRHNRRYWANAEYLGLGTSAHSYRGGVRWNNTGDSAVYMEGLECGRLPVERAEALSQRQRVGETLMLGLRQAEGVGEQEVEALCGLAAREVFEDEIEELCAEGLLMAAEGGLRIPVDKWLVSNEVLARFAA